MDKDMKVVAVILRQISADILDVVLNEKTRRVDTNNSLFINEAIFAWGIDHFYVERTGGLRFKDKNHRPRNYAETIALTSPIAGESNRTKTCEWTPQNSRINCRCRPVCVQIINSAIADPECPLSQATDVINCAIVYWGLLHMDTVIDTAAGEIQFTQPLKLKNPWDVSTFRAAAPLTQVCLANTKTTPNFFAELIDVDSVEHYLPGKTGSCFEEEEAKLQIGRAEEKIRQLEEENVMLRKRIDLVFSLAETVGGSATPASSTTAATTHKTSPHLQTSAATHDDDDLSWIDDIYSNL